MSSEFYTLRDTTQAGPFTGAELKALAARGHLLPTDKVSRDRLRWTTAAQIRGLNFAVAPPPVPPPVVATPQDPPTLRPRTVVGAVLASIVVLLGVAGWLTSPREVVKNQPVELPVATPQPVVEAEQAPEPLEDHDQPAITVDPETLPSVSANVLSQFCEQNKVLAHRVLNGHPIATSGTIETIDVGPDGSFVIGLETDSFRTLDCILPKTEIKTVETLRVGEEGSFAGMMEVDRHIRLLHCVIISDDGPANYSGFPELRGFERQQWEDAIAKHREAIEELKNLRGSTSQRREAKLAIQGRELRIKGCQAMIEHIDKGQAAAKAADNSATEGADK